MEFHSFTAFGDASEQLKDLYSKGWRLVTVVTPFAYTDVLPMYGSSHVYFYAVEYFLERPKT